MRPIEATDLLEAARALATDAAAVEVATALDRQGVDSILLKGPTTGEWLYPGEPRTYADADLLVAPDCAGRAARVLSELGFVPYEHDVSPHAHPWIRSSGAVIIDLHVTIWGTQLEPAGVWRELRHWVQQATVASAPVKVLTLPARALHLALHAAQHRDNLLRPREDLARALRFAPLEVWREAEMLADRLWALGTMADGLLLDPAGPALLERLPLARTAYMIDHRGVPPLALGLARFVQARGARAKAAVGMSALWSSAAPAAISGGQHQSLAQRLRLRRSASLLAALPGTILALRRARRQGPPDR